MRAKVALVFVVALFAMQAAASVMETGVSVLLSVGDEKRAVEALIVFTDKTGAILTPSNGVLTVPEGEPVNVQVFPKAPGGEKSFIVGYSTDTLMPKEPKRAEFDPTFGWYFQLEPEETHQPANWARALQIAVTNRDGRKSWIRVIFKITYGSGWLTQYDQLIIKTVPRAQLEAMRTGGVSAVAPAVEALKANATKTADYVNALEKRVTELESWAKSLGTDSTVSTSAQTVNVPVYFTGNFAAIGLRVTSSDGVAKGYVVKTTGTSLPLSIGQNSLSMVIDDGRGNLRKMRLASPITIAPDTKSVVVDIGGR